PLLQDVAFVVCQIDGYIQLARWSLHPFKHAFRLVYCTAHDDGAWRSFEGAVYFVENTGDDSRYGIIHGRGYNQQVTARFILSEQIFAKAFETGNTNTFQCFLYFRDDFFETHLMPVYRCSYDANGRVSFFSPGFLIVQPPGQCRFGWQYTSQQTTHPPIRRQGPCPCPIPFHFVLRSG